MDIAEKIRMARAKLKYSQLQLANAINVDKNTVWRWENKKTEPTAAEICKVATALNTSMAYLMGETDDPERHVDLQNMNTIAVDHSTAIGNISDSKSLSFSLPDTSERNIGQNIIFERGEGPNKIRMVLPVTPETYAFLREQGGIGKDNYST